MLMYLMKYFFVFMFLCGSWVFVSKRKHLLLMLLSLEFIVISLFMGLMVILSLYNYESYFSMFYLVFSVCEGALGLGILVSMIRSHGNDYFNSFNILKC
uniref:NADH-ubiquinone oxidoreductase chain 4L n=2 Tax=Corydalus TaxID=50555 RepID=A0A8K1T7F6_9NEOP|nr:NADH dehydrogenase subunit 4L [Corydalus cornutus]ACH89984.1 NADH dehydrogenase subunit 4L [Corydalus cornutus]UFZ12874.1 NADH dehydrogenase subunit 4L [Corydalus sp. 1 YLJ-2021a]